MGVRRGGSRARNNGASLIGVRRGTCGNLPDVQTVLEAVYAQLVPTIIRIDSEGSISESNGPNQLIFGDPTGGTFILNLPPTPSDGFRFTVKNIADANFIDMRAGPTDGIETGNPPAAAWGVSSRDAYVFVYNAIESRWYVVSEYDYPAP